jgi:prepilin-type N-terminal cleavage/methylation domain-containing protein/prepilin-type processing-associated H-X9-DG protein
MLLSPRRAFTLIELLVVISIIALLAALLLPVYNTVLLNGKKTQSMANMRQLGVMLVSYTGDQNGSFPLPGTLAPTWAGAASTSDTNETNAWYNALPRLSGQKGVGDYQLTQAAFYQKGSVFLVPAAQYPTSKLNAPLFAVAYNSKLFGTAGGADAITSVRLQSITLPSQTCVFQESGLSGEPQIYSSQAAYNGQSASYATQTVARYGGHTLIAFADGHVAELAGSDVVNPASGKAYSPQNLGEVYWTVDPTVDANNM